MGPNWVLDQNMLVNHDFSQRSTQVTKATNNVTGVSVVSVDPTVEYSVIPSYINILANGNLRWIILGFFLGRSYSLYWKNLFTWAETATLPYVLVEMFLQLLILLLLGIMIIYILILII